MFRPTRPSLRLAVALGVALALSACGGRSARPEGDLAASRVTTIGVNSYLWRATLDTLSFMPLLQTDSNGGVVVTDNAELYEKAFGFHDQGHKPFRSGVEVGRRDILGLNFRFNELLSAVALAQLGKIDNILATLRAKKNQLKSLIGDIPGIRFRTLNDPEGECATLCTIIFDDPQHAARVGRTLGTMTIENSGWHVYANMEHVNRHLESVGQPHGKGAYPQTDDILARAMNISIGVVDGGLGAGFGLCINSDEDEIVRTAKKFRNACLES